jgi:hypothetical protein
MRKLLVLLVVALASPARAEVTGCELSIELKGAVVDAWMTERVTTGTNVDEVTLPAGAQLIDVRVGTARAVPVTSDYAQEPATDAVGADPAIATALTSDERGRARYRVIFSPIEPAHDLQLALHWTALADIRGGALRLTLPARVCHGTVRVTPGPGAALSKITVGGVETRGAFEVGEHDAEVVAQLAYAKPLVWTQTEALGDGYTARVTTLAAPTVRALGARRVLLLIDGSRSMKLVGEPAVAAVVRAIGAALPAKAEIEGVIFDRTPARILGEWRPADAATLGRIEEAVRTHPSGNGSDAAAALGLAHNLIADTRGEAMIIVITDGVFGGVPDDSLVKALASSELAVDVHTIALDRGWLHAQNTEAIEATVAHYGGSFVEVTADQLDTALGEIESWLRPSAQVRDQRLLAGTGTVDLAVDKGAVRGTPAPVAQLVLARTAASDLADEDASDATMAHLEDVLARIEHRHPMADADHALAVLATKGTVARARHDAVAGGGPFARTVVVADPTFPPEVAVHPRIVVGGSAIDHKILENLFALELQPKAYVCYQKAIAKNNALAGTVVFHLELGRGEVTRATVDGVHDPAFDACLLDAAYAIAPPMPDPSYNLDDRTLANYPVTFAVRAQHPLVIPGDADSSTPLDIDAIKGGPPPRHIEAGDTSTPLGNLRPSQSP